jgi:hypothetical protein
MVLANPKKKTFISHLHHDQWVGGLHGEHKVVVVVLAAHVCKLKG